MLIVCVCVCVFVYLGELKRLCETPPPRHTRVESQGRICAVCVCFGGGGGSDSSAYAGPPWRSQGGVHVVGGGNCSDAHARHPPPHGPLRGQVESQGRTYVFCGGGQYCHVGPCGFQAEPLFFKIAQKISNVTRTRDRALFDI